ncbi:hypothetical protein EV360DRAFT_77306, partial [Lentinula raphanica]
DVATGDVEVGDIKAGDVEFGAAGDIAAGDVEVGDVEVGDVEAGDITAEDLKAGDIKTGDIEAVDTEAGGVRTRDVETVDIGSGDVRIEDGDGDIGVRYDDTGDVRAGGFGVGGFIDGVCDGTDELGVGKASLDFCKNIIDENGVVGVLPNIPRRKHPMDPTFSPLDADSTSPVLATPSVRHFARQRGVDLAQLVPGSGRDGRITRRDIDEYLLGVDTTSSQQAPVLVAGQDIIAAFKASGYS